MSARIRVGLFVTCLVDLVRPQVGFAAVKLLEQAGCIVEVPAAQTCCGQPAWNAGADAHAKDIARAVIAAFEGFDYVVAPSGSCAGMLKSHLPYLFEDDPNLRVRADRLAERTFELTSFLVDVLGFASFRCCVTPAGRTPAAGDLQLRHGLPGVADTGRRDRSPFQL